LSTSRPEWLPSQWTRAPWAWGWKLAEKRRAFSNSPWVKRLGLMETPKRGGSAESPVFQTAGQKLTFSPSRTPTTAGTPG
jgi:hypothetical protein